MQQPCCNVNSRFFQTLTSINGSKYYFLNTIKNAIKLSVNNFWLIHCQLLAPNFYLNVIYEIEVSRKY